MVKPFPGLIDPPNPGKELRLGSFLFFVPPMLLVDMRATIEEGLLDSLNDVQRATDVTAEQFGRGLAAIVKVLHRALKRNYPDITPAEIEGLLDVANCVQVVRYVLAANDLTDDPSWARVPTPAALAPTSLGSNGVPSTAPSGESLSAASPAPSGGISEPSTIN